MNTSGVSRRIDELGRIVIPIEIRRLLNIKDGENIEFNVHNNEICLRKRSYIDNNYDFFNSISNSLSNTISGEYFITDREKIICSTNNNLINIKLNSTLLDFLNVHNQSVINNGIKSDVFSINNTVYTWPYYFENDIAGLICLYNIDDINKYKKLIKFVTSYIHHRISLS